MQRLPVKRALNVSRGGSCRPNARQRCESSFVFPWFAGAPIASRAVRRGQDRFAQITARHAEIDIVVIAVAERAGEIVETLRDFPE